MLFSRRVWLLARRRKSAWASSSLGPPLSSRSDSTDEPRPRHIANPEGRSASKFRRSHNEEITGIGDYVCVIGCLFDIVLRCRMAPSASIPREPANYSRIQRHPDGVGLGKNHLRYRRRMARGRPPPTRPFEILPIRSHAIPSRGRQHARVESASAAVPATDPSPDPREAIP